MKTPFKSNLLPFVFAVVITIAVYSCKDSVTNTPITYDANSINGKVTFVEGGFILSGGTYLISAYPESGWPPMGPPAAYDTLHVMAGMTAYNYKLAGLSDGNYVVTVGFRKATGGQSPIMGIYGCDTSHSFSCLSNPTLKAQITNNAGVGNIDFLSWADTANKIY